MDKKTFVKAIEFANSREELSFVIRTNIPIGRGLNGVGYSSFSECHEYEDFVGGARKIMGQHTAIVVIEDCYIHLRVVDRNGNIEKTSHHFIPLENVVDVILVPSKIVE